MKYLKKNNLLFFLFYTLQLKTKKFVKTIDLFII